MVCATVNVEELTVFADSLGFLYFLREYFVYVHISYISINVN